MQLDKALTIQKDFPAALRMRARYSRIGGKHLEAFADYAKAFTVAPQSEEATRNLEAMLRTDESLGDAVEELVHWLESRVASEEHAAERDRLLGLLFLALAKSGTFPGRIEILADRYRDLGLRSRRALAEVARSDGRPADEIRLLEEIACDPRASLGDRRRLREVRERYLPHVYSFASLDGLLGEEVIVGASSPWRYWTPRDEPRTDWRELDFDDGEWSPGRGGLLRGATSLYLRVPFEIDEPSRYRRFRLSVEAPRPDEFAQAVNRVGFSVSVNGVEAVRHNAGRAGEPLTHRSLPVASPQPGVEWTLPRDLFRVGPNVLAIHCLVDLFGGVELECEVQLYAERVPDTAEGRALVDRLEPGFGGEESFGDALEARAAIREGRCDAAVGALERLHAVDPGSPFVTFRLAEALRCAGQPQVAISVLEESIAQQGFRDLDIPHAWFGVALGDLGLDAGSVRRRWSQLVRSAPADSLGTWCEDALSALDLPASGEAVRINCGGGDYEEPGGRKWSADRLFLAGTTHDSRKMHFALQFKGADDDTVYRTERLFVENGSPGYAIPLTPGLYRVSLHFTELSYGVSKGGYREFTVTLEDTPHGPIEPALGIAQRETFDDVEVADGLLDIGFVHGLAGVPNICGIEIENTTRRR